MKALQLPLDICDFGEPDPQELSGLQRLEFVQHWAGTVPDEKAHAYVGYCDVGIRLYAYLEEKEPMTFATARNQRLYELGSVVEFFIRPQDSEWYREIHLSPNGLIADLYIPNRDNLLADRYSWDIMTGKPSGTLHRVMPVDGAWVGDLLIPWSAFNITKAPVGQTWTFSVCRFNYTERLSDPEASSTAKLRALNFHQIEDFDPLEF